MTRLHRFKVPAIILTLYSLVAHLALENLHDQSQQVVASYFGNTTLLVVAHPDDETMFFGPTILNLLKNNKSLIILCLSDGNAGESGRQRELELKNVVQVLGPGVSLELIRDKRLPDSLTEEWNTLQVANYIERRILAHPNSIQTLVTFDSFGVSGHTNHRAIHKATEHLKSKLKDLKVDSLVLQSVYLWRKYTSFLDSVITLTFNYYKSAFSHHQVTLSINLSENSSLKQTLRLHQSQMAWFRQLYMIFSRYMFINDFELSH